MTPPSGELQHRVYRHVHHVRDGHGTVEGHDVLRDTVEYPPTLIGGEQHSTVQTPNWMANGDMCV